MRLEAQKVLGYYPAPLGAIEHAAKFLRAPAAGCPFAILDPCAGEGLAIGRLADLLGCQPQHTYAVELDECRTETLRANLMGANLLAPAAFGGCQASPCSFSLIYLNPPFDSAYDGGRVEGDFLRQAIDWLMPDGILVLVCPEDQVERYSIRTKLMEWFDNIMVVPFPAEHRPYTETFVFGIKRRKPRERNTCWVYDDEPYSSKPTWKSVQAPADFVYHLPIGMGPRRFVKVAPTEPELHRLLAASPLRVRLTKAPVVNTPSPPLALGIGHVALLLASGHLDGVVKPDGCRPHVVRGTSRKVEYISAYSEEENDDGSTTTRTTKSERIDLVVRTLSPDGTIRTFATEPPEDATASANAVPANTVKETSEEVDDDDS